MFFLTIAPSDLRRSLAGFSDGTVCLDMETAMAPISFRGREHVRLLQLYQPGNEAAYDLADWDDEHWDVLQEWLADPSRMLVGHNIAYDLRCLLGCGMKVAGTLRDTMIAAQVLENGQSAATKKGFYSLAGCALRHLHLKVDKTFQTADWMNIDLEATPEAVEYGLTDVRTTYDLHTVLLPELITQGLSAVYRLECAVLPVTVEMEHTGFCVDRRRLDGVIEDLLVESPGLLDLFLERLDDRLQAEGAEPLYREDGKVCTRPKASGRGDAKKPAGLNPNSPAQLLKLFHRLDIDPVSPEGKPTLDQKCMGRWASDPLVADYIDFKKADKRLTMLRSLHTHLGEGERIFAQFNQMRTGTGRYSCVSGDTVLHTSRGSFRFDEYLPLEGDRVLTHAGRWMPVVRKIYKGVDRMVCLQTTEGGKLTCTTAHRILTPSGWVRVGDLHLGDTVVHQPDTGQRRCLQPKGGAAVQGGGQAHLAAARSGAGSDLPHRCSHPEGGLGRGGVPSREGSPLLAVQNNRQPYAGQEWFPAPQLQGVGIRSQGLLHGAGRQRRAGDAAPAGDGRSLGVGEAACVLAGASHRRKRGEQLSGQPGVGDCGGARAAARQTAQVVSFDPVGTMGVWDIEVAGDHSYAAGGFYSHNSSSPNLQNVPREPHIRNIFCAPPGRELVVVDVKNMEMGVAASEGIANETRVQEALRDGVDLHTLTAHLIFDVSIEEVEKPQRQKAKSCNFGLLYGSRPQGLVNYFSTFGQFISLEDATGFRERWLEAYPGFANWHRDCSDLIPQGEVRMVDGRRRFLPGDMARLTVIANNMVQGTSASIVKRTMSLAWEAMPAIAPSARFVAQVHDELVVECDAGAGEGVLSLLLDSLGRAGKEIIGTSVRMTGEGAVVQAWGEAK